MPDKDSLLTLLNEWLALSKSGALKDLFNILSEHRRYCEMQALVSIKNNDMRSADRWQAKAEDALKVEECIRKRIDELKKNNNG